MPVFPAKRRKAEYDGTIEPTKSDHQYVFRERMSNSEGKIEPASTSPPRSIEFEMTLGETIALKGCGYLEVLEGHVDVLGYHMNKNKRMNVKADGTFPVVVKGVGDLDAKVPYAARDHARVRLVGKQEGGLTICESNESDCITTFVPNEWEQVVGEVTGECNCIPVIVVCGAKNTGKSLLCRYIVNMLLNQSDTVEFMDIDCGQAECTPPGMVSLFNIQSPLVGPPYYRQEVPRASYFVGDTSPASNPERFVNAVHHLYLQSTRMRHESHVYPLVINTYGWIQGMGLHVLTDILRSLPVTHLMRLLGENPRHNLPEGIFWELHHNLPKPLDYALPSIHFSRQIHGTPDHGNNGSKANTSAVERRALQWNAFAAKCCGLNPFENVIQSNSRIVGDALAGYLPYCIPMASISIEALFSSIPKAQLHRVLNASVVGLCHRDISSDGDDQNPLTPCLGLGIVRAVDVDQGLLYMLTPVEESILHTINHLQVGKLELPSSLLQTDTFKSPFLAIYAMSSEGTGAGSCKSRNNLMRSSHL